MDWIANNWQYIFRLSLAIFAFLFGTLLLTNRKYATGYAGWLYNFGLLDPKLRESTAPARKAAWMLYFLGLLALAWFGWYWHYFHTLPEVKDVKSPYEQKQPGFKSPYARPGTQPPGTMNRPTQPAPPPRAPSSTPPSPSSSGKEEPPLENAPTPRAR
jgi:hypothetical protein